MKRLTVDTPKGPALKLDNPQTEQEAREQLMEKYTIAIRKLARYEDLEEQGRLVKIPCAECNEQACCKEVCDGERREGECISKYEDEGKDD